MGTFSVAVQVGDLAGRQFVEIEALVDTGASDAIVPRSLLSRLGIDVIDRYTYRLADEKTGRIRHRRGEAAT